MLDIEQTYCNFSKLLTNFIFLGGHIHTKAPRIIYLNYNLLSAKCNKNKLNRTPKHDFMRLYFPLPQCGKNGQKISENILKYYRKSEFFFIEFLSSEIIRT